MLVNRGFNVCVIIDKPGRHNETGDVDGDVGVVSAQGIGANCYNAIAFNSNVTGKRWVAEPIDNGAACKNYIERFAGICCGFASRRRRLAS